MSEGEPIMRRVIIESPYAGEIEANVTYARRAVADSLALSEAPIASHLLYNQPGVLDDSSPGQRFLGITAGLAWRQVAELQVFYTDRGWSNGMIAALWQAIRESRPIELRALDGAVLLPTTPNKSMTDYLLSKTWERV